MTEPSNYADLLAIVRADLDGPGRSADLPGFEAALGRAQRRTRVRRLVAALGISLAIAIWIGSVLLHPVAGRLCPGLQGRDVFDIGLVPALNLLACLALLHRDGVGAQVFVRACCWSYLVVGAISTWATPGLMPWVFPAAAFGCGTALLALGRQGLEPERYTGVFRPVAHRGALTWTMVLAVADMQTLLAVSHSNRWVHVLTGACAVAMVIAVLGLFRLRVWALLLNLGLNIIVAILALTGALAGLPDALAFVLAATAVAQLALLLPLGRSLVRGEAVELTSLQPLGRWIGRGVVVLLMIIAMIFAVREPDARHFSDYCAAQMFEPHSLH